MKISFLGHRIQDMGGFDGNQLQEYVYDTIADIMMGHFLKDPKMIVLTSLNIGIEMWAGELARNNQIDYHVYIPFHNPHSKWPLKSRQEYTDLVKHCSKKITIDDGEYDAKKLNEKDIQLITNSDIVYLFLKDLKHPLIKICDKLKKEYKLVLPDGHKDDYFIQI